MMTGRLASTLSDLHRDETELAAALLRTAGRHPADPEIAYVGHDLARWSRRHATDLVETAHRYGLRIGAEPSAPDASPPAGDPGLTLLAELRGLHERTAGIALVWDIVTQAAQALRDDELLALARTCHAQTQQQLAWSKALVKANAAQLLAVP
ncbi:hypothetical protein [Jiangella endophytica]|uniref:hypothetical protein n=1 Tax=Jiangella endophytica TaxID=1623398 RepID=UPI0013002B1F|nr:hypothetical protein [Jiangella endophytica]